MTNQSYSPKQLQTDTSVDDDQYSFLHIEDSEFDWIVWILFEDFAVNYRTKELIIAAYCTWTLSL